MALANRPHLLIVIAGHASYRDSKAVRKFAEANRDKIRLFFLPPHAPELNPDEQVWNEIKHRGVEKKPIKNKSDLEYRLYDGLEKWFFEGFCGAGLPRWIVVRRAGSWLG